jgi:hypothetical protein
VHHLHRSSDYGTDTKPSEQSARRIGDVADLASIATDP